MEPWLKYNYYCSFRSVLHVYKMKRTFSKQFSCIRNEKQVCEAFCIITKSENLFLKRFSLLQIKNIFSKRFAYLQNEKNTFLKHASSVQNDKYVLESFYISCDEKNTFTNRFACLGRKQILHFWSVFHFVRMQNMFSKRFECLQNRKNTFVKRFYLHRVETWFGNFFLFQK